VKTKVPQNTTRPFLSFLSMHVCMYAVFLPISHILIRERNVKKGQPALYFVVTLSF